MEREQLPLVVAVPEHDDDALLRFAAREALVRGCPVRLVHPQCGRDRARAESVVLSAIARAEVLAGPGVMVTGAVVTGPPVAAVLGDHGSCQGVVVRHRDVLRLQRVLGEDPGSAGDTAVICVPTTWSALPDDVRPVLVAVDDPGTARALITHGLELARWHGTSLRVVHARRLPRRRGTEIDARAELRWSEEMRSAVTAVVDACRSGELARVPVEVVIERGVPAEIVVPAAGDAQVVVLQRNRVTSGPEHVGRTTRAALHECPCPVVLLPPVPAAG